MGFAEISPSRETDRKWRLELIEQMIEALSNNCPITAKEIGKTTKWLDDRIRNRDYTEDDRIHYKVARLEPIKRRIETL